MFVFVMLSCVQRLVGTYAFVIAFACFNILTVLVCLTHQEMRVFLTNCFNLSACILTGILFLNSSLLISVLESLYTYSSVVSM